MRLSSLFGQPLTAPDGQFKPRQLLPGAGQSLPANRPAAEPQEGREDVGLEGLLRGLGVTGLSPLLTLQTLLGEGVSALDPRSVQLCQATCCAGE